MSQGGLSSFIGHRTEALAYVTLTMRPGVTVSHLGELSELDMLASFAGRNGQVLRFFGVILRGTSKSLDESSATRELNSYFRSSKKKTHARLYPFPVLALIFSIQSEYGFFDWRIEPKVDTQGISRLKLNEAINAKVMDRKKYETAVDVIENWYKNFSESLFED